MIFDLNLKRNILVDVNDIFITKFSEMDLKETIDFQKYMIDENGFLVDYVFSFKSPDCSKIVNWIEGK